MTLLAFFVSYYIFKMILSCIPSFLPVLIVTDNTRHNRYRHW